MVYGMCSSFTLKIIITKVSESNVLWSRFISWLVDLVPDFKLSSRSSETSMEKIIGKFASGTGAILKVGSHCFALSILILMEGCWVSVTRCAAPVVNVVDASPVSTSDQFWRANLWTVSSVWVMDLCVISEVL